MSLPDLNPDLLATGKLAEHPLVELLGIVFAHKRSGKIQLMRGRTNATIFIYNGIPVNAESNAPVQGILDLMVHDHRLAPDDVLQVKKLAEDRKMDIEVCLRDLLEVTESQIYYYRQQAVRQLIIKSCGWRDGFYTFASGEEFVSALELYDLNPLDLVYQGIVKYHSPTLASDIHAAENRTLTLNPEKREYFLMPGPLYDHSDFLDFFADGIRVGSAVSALQQEFGEINLALTTIYLLVVTGMVISPQVMEDEVFDEGDIFGAPRVQKPKARVFTPPKAERTREVIRPASAKPAPPRPTVPARVAPTEAVAPAAPAAEDMPADESSVYVIAKPRKLKKKQAEPDARDMRGDDETEEVTLPPSPEAAPPTAGDRPDKPAIRMRLTSPPKPAPPAAESAAIDPLKRMTILAGDISAATTHYDVLGAQVGADLPELRKFYATRRRLLVDGLQGEVPDEVRPLLEQALKKVEDAVAVLTDPAKRSQYEKALAAEETRRAWNMPMKKTLAHRMGERAKWYMLANAPEQARAFYLEAIELDPESPVYYSELGWSIFRHRPQEADEARSYLASAVKMDPNSDKSWYYLGVIAKRREETELAEKMFRRALEANPGSESARRELSYLNQHQKETGLWKKIFGG